MPFTTPDRRKFLALSGAAALGACTPALTEDEVQAVSDLERFGFAPAEGYGLIEDGGYTLPPIPPEFLNGVNQRTVVDYNGPESAGTIVVDIHAKLLYFVEEDGMARRYPIAVGRGARILTECLLA